MNWMRIPLVVLTLSAIAAPAAAQSAGWQKIFDGKTLEGWDGHPDFWSVKNGAITGETTKEKPAKGNTFLIWRGGEPGDFELKAEFLISAHNSGIQYRSFETKEKWVVGGYQADIDFGNNWAGTNYGERFGGILARRGETATRDKKGKRKIKKLADPAKLAKLIKPGQWNAYHIVAQGNHMVQKINGVVMSELIDNAASFRAKGLIALQLHAGPPMKIQFRNLLLKTLEPGPGAGRSADNEPSRVKNRDSLPTPLPESSARDHGTRQPDPDGKSGNMSKPVQVYILLGQSNMLGFGKVRGGDGTLEHAVKEKGLYPYLIDDAGVWTERKDVRNVRVMGSGATGMKRFNNEWMTIKGGKIGPEIGIGHYLGNAIDAPVMILKSCIGNRALGWDLLPPGSKGFEFTDGKGVTWVHPGYKGSPERWKKGTEPKKIGWYAGAQYDGDIARAKQVLSELDKHYPGAQGYEVAGFFWWQGDRDSRSAALSSRYEQNLVQLIKQLRKEFDAPNAKFVCATLGQTKKGATDNGGKVLDATLAVDGKSGKYPEFKDSVAAVYAHPLSKGGSSGGHYGGNAETYMNVGEAMGKAMVKLLEGK